MQSFNPNKPFEVKDARGNLIGYFWYYGNSVVLSFDVVGEYVSGSDTYLNVDDVVAGCSMTLTIYNSRHDIAYQKTVDAKSTVEFVISGQESTKLLKGKYTMQLVLSNFSVGYNETLFGSDTCIIEVR